MKKKANFIKFWATFRRMEEGDRKRIIAYCHRQYKLLCDGIRDVRIGDSAACSWIGAGGEW